MDSIFSLLRQKSSNQVVKLVIKHGEKYNVDFDKQVYQFFIDFFGRKFEFNDDHYDQIQECNMEMDDFALEIFYAKRSDEPPLEMNIKSFMLSLVYESFIAHFLTDSMVNNWVAFLTSLTNHPNISNTAKIKGQAYVLLSYMLEPLTKMMSLFDRQELDLDGDFKTAVTRSVERILHNISGAFKYEKYAIDCAKEFSNILTCNQELLLRNPTFLNHYRIMLQFDNRPILALAIKSINDLCEIDALEDVMRNFLFTINNDEETIVQIVTKLVNFRNLRHDVLGLLKTISNFRNEQDIITANEFSELFSNICSKSKKTIVETAELMGSLHVNFWLEFIKVLNFDADDDVDIKLVLSSIEPSVEIDLDAILKVVEEHINEPIVSRRAAEIFNEAFELSLLKEESISLLINTMKACTSDETTFIMLLRTFISIEKQLLFTFLKENVNYLTQILMPVISNAFVDYQKPASLNVIVNALKKLYIIEPITILSRVRDIANELLKFLLGLKIVEFTEREKIVPKLSALFECKAWRLLNDNSMIKLYTFCQKFCNNTNYRYFPQFQRLYVNLLKHIWVRLAANQPLLIEKEQFINETRYIHTQISNYLKTSKNIADNCLLLSSHMDLYMLFQPKIHEKFKNDFFKTFNIPLSKEDYIRLIDSMEHNLFPENEESSYHQNMLVQSFVTLYINYINIPSLTSWETLLRYYNAKCCTYKPEIEIIMNHVINMKNTIFEKSVAFAILNMAEMLNMEQFKSFFHAFDNFMRNKFPDFKERNVIYGLICSIVLERFSKTITTDYENKMSRLIVLEYIGFIVKSSDQSFSKGLINFIKINEIFLTDIEKRKLNDFKRILCDEGD